MKTKINLISVSSPYFSDSQTVCFLFGTENDQWINSFGKPVVEAHHWAWDSQVTFNTDALKKPLWMERDPQIIQPTKSHFWNLCTLQITDPFQFLHTHAQSDRYIMGHTDFIANNTVRSIQSSWIIRYEINCDLWAKIFCSRIVNQTNDLGNRPIHMSSELKILDFDLSVSLCQKFRNQVNDEWKSELSVSLINSAHM